MTEAGGDKGRNGLPDWLVRLKEENWTDDDPVLLKGPREAMNGMVENDEALRIAIYDASGNEIAAATGVIDGPEITKGSTFDVAEFSLSHDGLTIAARLPLDPNTQCVLYADGMMRGRLPSGRSWSLAPLEQVA